MPLDHFQSSKYTIPIFTAPYLQADVYSVPQGGLPERQPGQEYHPVGKLKLWFMESGGIAFRDAVDMAKVLWQERRQSEQDQDALRKYADCTLSALLAPETNSILHFCASLSVMLRFR